jgi:hypothetical protein
MLGEDKLRKTHMDMLKEDVVDQRAVFVNTIDTLYWLYLLSLARIARSMEELCRYATDG